MVFGKKKTIDDKFKEELKNISTLRGTLRGLDTSQSIKERSGYYTQALGTLSKDLSDQAKVNLMREFEESTPEFSYEKISRAFSQRIGDVTPEYQRLQDQLTSQIKSKLDEKISKQPDKAEAVKALMPYFEGFLPKMKVSQEEADELACKELSEAARMPLVTRAKGSPEAMAEMITRAKVSELLAQDKKGNYRVDKAKLKPYMDKVEIGATLYSSLVK